MTTKRDRAAAAAFFNDQPEWDLTIAHWIETGEKRYGMGTVRPNVIALAEAFAAHAAGIIQCNIDKTRSGGSLDDCEGTFRAGVLSIKESK